jgi:hypothetical protein
LTPFEKLRFCNLFYALSLVHFLLKFGAFQKNRWRMSQEEEFEDADLKIYKITASPDRETSW